MSQEENRNTPQRAGRSGGEAQRQAARRRRRRGILNALGALLYVVLVIGASCLLACVAWAWAGDVLALDKEPHTATITLPEDIFAQGEREIEVEEEKADGTVEVTIETEEATVADIEYVAALLKENGLIEYEFVFKLFSKLTEAQYNLTPGTYELNTDMDYRALISSMGQSSVSRSTTVVTLTEGMTVHEIFQKLSEAGVSTMDKLNDTAANYDFKFSFLKDVVPLGEPNRLEGYLFPDTYEFYLGEDPVSAINKMLLRFDEMFNDDMRELAAEQGLTVQDAVTIASMIEKETDGSDQTRISSVIYNRLNSPAEGGTYGYLNIDATILYATGGPEVDTTADTPYNTYTHTGLPPTAIGNPGIIALRSALYPADEDYYYYALGDDGLHHYYRTYDELLSFIASQERYQDEGE